LAIVIATLPTSSACVERVFSEFKSAMKLELNQGRASPQYQAACLFKLHNARALNPDHRELLRRCKISNRLKSKSRHLLDPDLMDGVPDDSGSSADDDDEVVVL
jgi:hypothetical protein